MVLFPAQWSFFWSHQKSSLHGKAQEGPVKRGITISCWKSTFGYPTSRPVWQGQPLTGPFSRIVMESEKSKPAKRIFFSTPRLLHDFLAINLNPDPLLANLRCGCTHSLFPSPCFHHQEFPARVPPIPFLGFKGLILKK